MTAALPLDLAGHEVLHDLTSSGVLSSAEAARVQDELHRGATLYTALSLMTDERAVWASFARTHQRPFLRSHHELQVFFTDLFTFDVALGHQILPWNTRRREMQVLTYNPERVDGPNPAVPGYYLTHTLISPTVWRYLYDLAYPTSHTGTLSHASALALVTLTPVGTPTTTTPEQNAEILAATHGYHYIDLRREPVHETVRALVTTPLKALTRAYPHRLEGNRLVMMMVDPQDESALHRLRQQTQLEIIATVTTQAVIDRLIARDQEDGLWKDDP